MKAIGLAIAILATMTLTPLTHAQTSEKGPWWPSPHGADDQAGNSNYITPEKIMEAFRLAKTGKVYELGHVYEQGMPQFGDRAFYLNVQPGWTPKQENEVIAQQEYFSGWLGHMGTQFDGLGHMGRVLRTPDGKLKTFYYNGNTQEDLTGANIITGGVRKLGVEHVRPIITRGILIDIAGYKGVKTLEPNYEVTVADMEGALAKQGMKPSDIGQGDAVFLNYGWAENWTKGRVYNDGTFDAINKGSPGLGRAGTVWLKDKKIVVVGADSCCVMMMPAPKTDEYNMHLDLLPNGVFLIENMDLRELAKDKAYQFTFLGLTLRMKGAVGSPMRPIAIR